MNKIAGAFQNKKAFLSFLTAGDPSLDKTAEYILAMQEAGADLIEIGIPFSDPIAEGEVIQRASLRALEQGVTLDGIFAMLESIRDRITVPLALMGYINSAFAYGYDRFLNRSRACGVSGLIFPDLPFEEQGELLELADSYGISLITLVAPTSRERVTRLAQTARGFLYLVSSLGVTGVRGEITTDIPALVESIKAVTSTPVAVGFGIATPEQAARYAQAADGVIVGSAIVKLIEEHGGNAAPALQSYIRDMKAGM